MDIAFQFSTIIRGIRHSLLFFYLLIDSINKWRKANRISWYVSQEIKPATFIKLSTRPCLWYLSFRKLFYSRGHKITSVRNRLGYKLKRYFLMETATLEFYLLDKKLFACNMNYKKLVFLILIWFLISNYYSEKNSHFFNV